MGRDIVVVGASAGGLPALQKLLSALPADYPGSVLIVVHIAPDSDSHLAAILGRAGPLRTVQARDNLPIEPGTVYVAPPDCHLLVEGNRMRVTSGPRENRHRPAIDPLFRSAAWAHGPRVVGVVLTGNLDDGTAGLWAVKSCGGVTVVQDPAEADHPEMPSNALMHNRIDHRLPLSQIAQLLNRLANEPLDADASSVPPNHADEKDKMRLELQAVQLAGDLRSTATLGALSPFTCPSCHGALWELEEAGHLRYRCHTGHAFSLPSLVIEQGEAVESSLFVAVRALAEKATALRRLAERWPDRLPGIKDDYQKRAHELDAAADVLRGLLSGAVR